MILLLGSSAMKKEKMCVVFQFQYYEFRLYACFESLLDQKIRTLEDKI